MNLREKSCVPCEAGTRPRGDAEVASLPLELADGIADPSAAAQPQKVHRRFHFGDEARALGRPDESNRCGF